MQRSSAVCCIVCAVCAGCTPLGDLDAAGRGNSGGTAGNEGGSSSGAESAGTSGKSVASTTGGAAAATTGGASSGGSAKVGGSSAGGQSSSQSGGAGPAGGSNGGGGATANGGDDRGGAGGAVISAGADSGGTTSTTGGAGGGTSGLGGTGGAPAPLPELPIDLPNSPVNGEITFSAEATWEVDGTQEPAFEVRTPTAKYFLVKPLASIVSIEDGAAADSRQWIDYSSSFRPLRSVPSFGSFGAAPKFTTSLDVESQTPGHLRLLSDTESRDWQLVWDFYLTHVTITVNRAPVPYGFAYRGVPGGALDDQDSFLSSDGVVRSAKTSRVADFPGSEEWASVADGTLGRTLFLIQHGDDSVADRYQVKDGDSAMILFGDGKLVQVPIRFSLGLLTSADSADIRGRVEYVIGAIQ